jgi:voltage-gated potassium channel
MTIITLSTVGYGETHELSREGRWFTSGLILLCFVGMTCWTASLTSFLVEADLGGQILQRRMLRMISQLKGHSIVCGTTQMAEAIVERLVRKRKDVVVIDDDKEKLEALRRRFKKIFIVEGPATNELHLAQANVLSAAHVVAALSNEVDNLLISITCKDLGEDIAVYAKSNDATIANRMRKAGVEEVICPSQLCGDRVSDLILA